MTSAVWFVAGAKELDIAATLEHLRDQRPGMVQTKVGPAPAAQRPPGGGEEARRRLPA